MDDLRAAIRLAVRALRAMADEAGIAPDRADTMAADLALHIMRLARRPGLRKLAESAPHLPRGLRYKSRNPRGSE